MPAVCHALTTVCAHSVENIAQAFHFENKTLSEAAAAAVSAGCDIDCGSAYSDGHLGDALQQHLIPSAKVDLALSRMLTQQFALGLYDSAEHNPYRRVPHSIVGSDEHLALAQRAAEAGIVLLKNRDSTLPLVDKPRVAVLGANGNNTLVLLGNYHGTPAGNNVSTPYEAIVARVGQERASYVPGVWPSGEGTWDFGKAIDAAAAADVAVIAVGSSSTGTLNGFTDYTTIEKESMDRKSLVLPGMQLDFIKAIATQTATKIVVVLVHGGPLDVEELLEMERVGAVLSAGYGGQRAGVALANVLWGTRPPTGRLPMTWPFNNFTKQVHESDMRMRPEHGFPGRTHRYSQVPALFEFG